MYNVRYLLVSDGWQEHVVPLEQEHIALAYVAAIQLVKLTAGISTLDFIPLGSNEHLIWGQGKCQGYMSIKREAVKDDKEETVGK